MVRKKQPIKRLAGKVVLVLVMLTAVALGAWSALSPTLEKNRILELQTKLLDSIENSDGVIVLDEAFATTDVDFYDNSSGNTLSGTIDSVMPVSELEATVETATIADTVVAGIGVLTINKIGVKLPVTEGVSSTQLKVAVGHVPQTPEIGATGNAVIAGHRSYTYGQFFNRLGEIEVGDIISYMSKDGDAIAFEVYEILEVLPGDPAVFEQPKDKQVLTLYTCTPISTATHRLLVRAERIL